MTSVVHLNPDLSGPQVHAPFTLGHHSVAGLEGGNQVPEKTFNRGGPTSPHAVSLAHLSYWCGVFEVWGARCVQSADGMSEPTREARHPLCPQLNLHPPSIVFEIAYFLQVSI